MNGSVDRKTSSALSLWDACDPPTCGHLEHVDPAEPREDSRVHQTTSTTVTPIQEHLASQRELPIVPGDLEDSAYGQAAPLQTRFSGQGLGDYQDTVAGEVYGVLASDRVTDSPPLHPYPSQHTPDVLAEIQYDPPAATPTCYSPEFIYNTHPHIVPHLPGPHTDIATSECEDSDLFGSGLPVNGVPTADSRFHVGDQFSSATHDDGYGPYDGRAPMIPHSSGTYYLHPAVMEHRSLLANSQPTPTVFCAAHDFGYIHSSSSLPAGGVGNEGETQLPAGSPPAGSKSAESKSSKKRKRATTLDGKREPKCTRQRRSQRLGPREPTQPTLPPIPPSHFTLHVMEQVPYHCKTQQKGWTPLPSIDFRVQGRDGMNLTDALNVRFDGPDGRDDLMFTHDSIGNSVSCRMEFKGYPACGQRQITTTNHKKERDRISKKKLAQDIARRVEFYLEELEEGGTPFPVPFEDMLLVGLHNVARASWQPEFWHRVSSSTSS